MQQYSTLGYTPNPLIEKYEHAFLGKLQDLWSRNIDKEIPPDEFLLFPDIHALLLATGRPNTHDTDTYRNILLSESELFRVQKSIVQGTGEYLIPGTKIELSLKFYNPDVNNHTHPEHKKNNVSVTFGQIPAFEWGALFGNSFQVVQRVSPGFMDEISRIIKKIIPFDVSHGVHNSGSYSDVIGHLLMSYPTGMDFPELALLEAILHEYNHNKLNLILQTETLILNHREEIYYSPYRPDPRHIHGIYLGLHALAGAYWVIWNAHSQGILQLPENWQEKAVLYVLKNGLSLQILDKYAYLSPLGKEILEEMRQVHQECLGYIKKSNISSEIIKRAKTGLVTHHKMAQESFLGLRS